MMAVILIPPLKLWHLAALVGASALAFGLARLVGPAMVLALVFFVGILPMIRAILRANRAAFGPARGWIDRAEGGVAGLAIDAAGMALIGVSVMAAVGSTVALVLFALIGLAMAFFGDYGK